MILKKIFNYSCGILLFIILVRTTHAQLAVTILSIRIEGDKVLVPLTFGNHFSEKIESARAVCFLLDDQGKMVGNSTKWVIGQNKTDLAPGATNKFNFVITSPKGFTTTNLTAKISFTRLALEGGKVADVRHSVEVISR